jgi:hypothetical protein
MSQYDHQLVKLITIHRIIVTRLCGPRSLPNNYPLDDDCHATSHQRPWHKTSSSKRGRGQRRNSHERGISLTSHSDNQQLATSSSLVGHYASEETKTYSACMCKITRQAFVCPHLLAECGAHGSKRTHAYQVALQYSDTTWTPRAKTLIKINKSEGKGTYPHSITTYGPTASICKKDMRLSLLLFWVVTSCGLVGRYQELRGWTRGVCPKCRYQPLRAHSAITHTISSYITAVRTSRWGEITYLHIGGHEQHTGLLVVSLVVLGLVVHRALPILTTFGWSSTVITTSNSEWIKLHRRRIRLATDDTETLTNSYCLANFGQSNKWKPTFNLFLKTLTI